MWYIFMIGIALTAGFSLIGPAVAMYSDTVLIQERVATGELTGKVVFTEVDESGEICAYDGTDGHLITFGIEGSGGAYGFTLENRGTIPVRLSPTITAAGVLEVDCDLPSSLDPGETAPGWIALDAAAEAGDYSFQVDIECIQWNADSNGPDWWRDVLRIDGLVTLAEPSPDRGVPEESPQASGQEPSDRLALEQPENIGGETVPTSE